MTAQQGQTERQLRRYVQHLQTMRKIDQALLTAQAPELIIRLTLEHLPQLVTCQRASVALFDHASGEASVTAMVHGQTAELQAPQRVPLSALGLPDEPTTGVARYLPDLKGHHQLPVLLEQLRQQGMRSVLQMPLRVGDEGIGLLHLASTRPAALEPEDREIVSQLADRLALALQQGRLHARVLQHTSLLEQRVAERTAELRAANQQLAQLARLNQLILHSAGEGIMGLNEQGLISFVNPAAARLLGYHPDELLGQLQHQLLHHSYADGSPYPLTECPIMAALLDGTIHRAGDEIFWRKDGTSFPIDYISTPIQVQGRIVGAVIMFRDITEQRRIESALQQAKEEAERANQAKSEFLSRMSHELRTPLNAILGFAQLLELDELPDHQRESVEHILKGGRHLLGLINEILDIARIESGRLALSPEPISLRDVLEESLSLIQPQAAQRAITLTTVLSQGHDQHVLADRQRLKQVLLNVLSNAVKYNREAGSISISCQDVALDRVRVLVRDTGIGIPPGSIQHLFIPFQRLEAAQTGVEGIGLGLALSKALMQAMDGSIGVESELGQGSTFWIELPCIERPSASLEQLARQPAAQAQPASRQQRVLLIEDNLANLRLIEHILARRPATQLLAAMQGQLGLELAREQHPDLILLDLHLPDIPGSEVLHRLQADPSTRDTPVLVISADATPRQRERLLAAGARAYLTKPLDVAQFLQMLDQILKS